MTKFWKSPWGCAAMILMGLTLWGGLIVYFARKSDPFLAEVTLADGKTRLRLLSISEGPFDYEWQPPRSSMIFPWGSGIPSISIHLSGIDPWTREPGYTWMFRTVDETGQYKNANNPLLNFEFVDSNGFVYRRFGAADFPHFGAFAFTRSNYPRRDREIRIRIRDNAQLISEMRVPNPGYRESFPTWIPQSLPVDLIGSSVSARVRSIDYFESQNIEGIVQFQIESLSDSPEWKNCIFDTTLEDATGNRGRELSPFEPAWKVHVLAFRNPESEFPARLISEKVTLTIPTAGQLQNLDQVLEYAGEKCRLLCIAGPGKIEYSNNAFTNEVVADAPNSTSYSSGSQNGRTYLSTTSSKPQLFFTWEKTADPTRTGQGIQFLSDTRDHVLRQVMPDGKFLGHRFGLMFDGQREMYVCELQNDAGTPSATIQVANNPPEKLEFKVAPPQKAIDCWKKKAEEFDAANAK